MDIPTIVLPEPLVIPEQTIPLPTADLPSYIPIVCLLYTSDAADE